MAKRKSKKRKRKSKRGQVKKKPKLGSGKRFDILEKKLEGRKGVYDPAGLAAYIGRKKYGKKKMSQLSRRGMQRKRG